MAQKPWLKIINEKFIPLLRGSGFPNLTLCRVVSAQPVESFTYSLMVEAADMEEYKIITGKLFDEYKETIEPLFGEKVLSLTTLLKKFD